MNKTSSYLWGVIVSGGFTSMIWLGCIYKDWADVCFGVIATGVTLIASFLILAGIDS